MHISTPGEKGRYVTLSHCWGPGGIDFLLKEANIEQLRHAIHTEALPRSFQDAIVITRRLGFRFLWMDAICIVQDSLEDWARESSVMADIYRNGTVMISATAASDSHHGILSPRDVFRSHCFGRDKEFVFQAMRGSMNALEPLHARGWCLQERVMAPRILQFGRHMLFWECVSQVCAEDSGLVDLESGRTSEHSTRVITMPFIWPPNSGSEMSDDTTERLAAFYQCISEFTTRKLSKRSDKLPAFSGLASAFHTHELGTYLAGLWEKDLVYGLQWSPREPSEEPPEGDEYIAPSWSWASMRGSCVMPRTRHNATDKPHDETQSEHFNNIWSPQLLSHRIKQETEDPYGRISAASIKLCGYTRSVHVWSTCTPLRTGWDMFEDLWDCIHLDREGSTKSSNERYLWRFELPHERVPEAYHGAQDAPSVSVGNKTRRFVALALSVKPLGRPSFKRAESLSMLLLEPVKALEDSYRRVGLVTFISMDGMQKDGWEQKSLTLI